MSSLTAAGAAASFQTFLTDLLSRSRDIKHDSITFNEADSISGVLSQTSKQLHQISKPAEAEALDQVREKISESPSFGGLGLSHDDTPTTAQYSEIKFLCEAWLESVKSGERSNDYLSTNPTRPQGAKPMTLAQKIFTQHALGSKDAEHGLALGDVVRVGVDWIIASELSWAGMAKTYEELGSPGIWRNDRFWIAGDHVVHPSIADNPKIKAYIDASEKAKKDFFMTENQGMNYTIMHTEFVRERAEPGMLVIGSDSHTCSAGAVGCLSIGLGTADVMMTLSLGETWFKIPESILIELKGKPSFGMSGKDVILKILKELKRNTVAAERIVEFAGEGVKYLSVDARFAICNMCTEFGAITGVFVPDEVTQDYIGKRRRKTNCSHSVYFRPDPNAEYFGKYTIDLSTVEPSVAIYPNPDDVVPVSQMAGTKLDGVFIGACTTTEEELVLAALVLKIGLAKGLPLAKGKRRYVPGSLPIVQKLQDLGLLAIYEEAGFTRGPPGCSLCVGISAEKAEKGETWLSSQNRNFQNRMGVGSFGHLSSAMVCAASSFSMTITGLEEFLNEIDVKFFHHYKGVKGMNPRPVQYVEPKPQPDAPAEINGIPSTDTTTANDDASENENTQTTITSKIVTLGDFIDTDALAPGPTLTTCKTDEEFGQHVLEYTHPDFRAKVKGGQQVVVAGHGMGVGSSRECAVSALKGAGVKAVIARSFAFIYSRNQPSLGLLGIVMEDDDFYAAALEGEDINIDVGTRSIEVAGKKFPFRLSNMEYKLTVNNGIAKTYGRFGKAIWQRLMQEEGPREGTKAVMKDEAASLDSRLNW
jgi:homoaconitase/3-isopropylmalate dehydratase large subunit/3-isopropylmalate dehydratase small subunit